MKGLKREQVAYLLLLMGFVATGYGGIAYALAQFVRQGDLGAITITAAAAAFFAIAVAQLYFASERLKLFNEELALLKERCPKAGRPVERGQ